MTARPGSVSAPRAKRRARMRELAVVPSLQQDLFSSGGGAQVCSPAPSPLARAGGPLARPEVLLARVHELRIEAQNHSRLQREHARAAAALLNEAVHLEQQALQLALPLANPGGPC